MGATGGAAPADMGGDGNCAVPRFGEHCRRFVLTTRQGAVDALEYPAGFLRASRFIPTGAKIIGVQRNTRTTMFTGLVDVVVEVHPLHDLVKSCIVGMQVVKTRGARLNKRAEKEKAQSITARYCS